MTRLAVPLLLLLASVAAAAEPRIPGIGPVGPVEKVHTGFKFVEGPTADGHGNLYFTDVRSNRIHRLGTDGQLVAWRENTNAANGLMFNAKGDLVACEMGSGQVAAYSPDGKERRVLADGYNGKRFNAPNDPVIDPTGGIYFPHPPYNAPQPFPPRIRTPYFPAPPGPGARPRDQNPPH